MPRISHFFGEGALAAELILSSRSPGPDPRYLAYHRARIFLAG